MIAIILTMSLWGSLRMNSVYCRVPKKPLPSALWIEPGGAWTQRAREHRRNSKHRTELPHLYLMARATKRNKHTTFSYAGRRFCKSTSSIAHPDGEQGRGLLMGDFVVPWESGRGEAAGEFSSTPLRCRPRLLLCLGVFLSCGCSQSCLVDRWRGGSCIGVER